MRLDAAWKPGRVIVPGPSGIDVSFGSTPYGAQIDHTSEALTHSPYRSRYSIVTPPAKICSTTLRGTWTAALPEIVTKEIAAPFDQGRPIIHHNRLHRAHVERERRRVERLAQCRPPAGHRYYRSANTVVGARTTNGK
jgi:hypothetical protein